MQPSKCPKQRCYRFRRPNKLHRRGQHKGQFISPIQPTSRTKGRHFTPTQCHRKDTKHQDTHTRSKHHLNELKLFLQSRQCCKHDPSRSLLQRWRPPIRCFPKQLNQGPTMYQRLIKQPSKQHLKMCPFPCSRLRQLQPFQTTRCLFKRKQRFQQGRPINRHPQFPIRGIRPRKARRKQLKDR